MIGPQKEPLFPIDPVVSMASYHNDQNAFKAALASSPMWSTKDMVSHLAAVSCEIASVENAHDIINTFRSELGMGSLLSAKKVTVGAFSMYAGKPSLSIRPVILGTPATTLPSDTPDEDVIYISK